ncbi:tetratricopeptide repeat protein [Kitasatospora sp. Ki12]
MTAPDPTDPMAPERVEQLLARARPQRRTTDDYPRVIRRIAHDLAAYRRGEYEHPAWWAHHSRARLGLDSLVRSVLTEEALAMVVDLAEQDEVNDRPAQLQHPIDVSEIDAEIAGFQIFGCLLYLAGHPTSAAFWWGMAAGAGDRLSATFIYLLHLQRGELRQAIRWFQEAHSFFDLPAGVGTIPPGVPDMAGYMRALPAHLIPWTSPENAEPTDQLAPEVERLVVRAGPGDAPVIDGVAGRPGPRLATQIEQLASH